jgi:Protein of unknown function (DUF2934)
MASKSSTGYGDNAPRPSSDGVKQAAAARPERTDKRPAAAASPSASRPPAEGSRAATAPAVAPAVPSNFDPSSSREALIATAAYYRAEKRGFGPGYEQEDWLAAEREVDGTGKPPTP